MSRDWHLWANDIVRACRKILSHTAGASFDEFVSNEMLNDAVVRNFMIIGEAAKNIPEIVRAQAPHIQWGRMVGMRNILAHEYFAQDDAILWNAARNYVPELLAAMQALSNGRGDHHEDTGQT